MPFGALPVCQETEKELQGHQLNRDLESVDRWLMIKDEEHEHMLTQALCNSAAAVAAEAQVGRRPQATPARANPPRPAAFSSAPPVPCLNHCVRRESSHRPSAQIAVNDQRLNLEYICYIALNIYRLVFLVGLCVVESFWACFGGGEFVVRVVVCC